jgi:hypothetical protein
MVDASSVIIVFTPESICGPMSEIKAMHAQKVAAIKIGTAFLEFRYAKK